MSTQAEPRGRPRPFREATPTHPLGDAQGAQALHSIQIEVVLSLAPDLLLMPSSGVI